jgi:pimeloyl-ACP methyl ester carboxylesterase/predicted glycosyltransferase
MAADAKLPERIERVVGSLPETITPPDLGVSPLETVTPTRDGFVERDGVRTYYALWGDSGHEAQSESSVIQKPVIVFAPIYQIVHMNSLKGNVPYLSRHFRVVTIDLRGTGRSDRPRDPEAYHFEHYYADMVAVLDHLKLERLAIVGISAAYMLAARLAAEQRERVTHLISVGGEFEWAEPTHEERAQAAHSYRHDFPGHLDRFFSTVFSEPHSTKPYEDGVLYGWSATGETMLMAQQGWEGNSVRDLLPQVIAPTLIIQGADDHMLGYQLGLELHALIPQSQMLSIGGGGHATQGREPVAFNRAVRDFVGAPWKERTWTRAMSRPRRALFVSSPIGLGHVQRDLAIARELRKLTPDLQIEWFTVDPAAAYLEREGEQLHPMTRYLSNESRHLEDMAGEHEVPAFFALRTMDEIMIHNFMIFSDLMEAEHFDLVIGDEAWDVDYYYHENPELKRQPFIFLSDFVGVLPVEGSEREAFLCADRNAEDVEHIARFPYIRDAAIFIGNPEDVTEECFGPGLPRIREWTDRHFQYSGYVLPFDLAQLADRKALRAKLGYSQDETLVMAAVGGTLVGRHLLHKIAAAFPQMKGHVPNLRLVLVTGPRLAGESFARIPSLEVKPYVHNLYEHLACCDLALVQGGLSTCMELVATRRPFLCFPLRRHFEQLIHVQRRLRNYGADCALDYSEVTPESLATAALDTMHKPVSYRPVETDGAGRVAHIIAQVLEGRMDSASSGLQVKR